MSILSIVPLGPSDDGRTVTRQTEFGLMAGGSARARRGRWPSDCACSFKSASAEEFRDAGGQNEASKTKHADKAARKIWRRSTLWTLKLWARPSSASAVSQHVHSGCTTASSRHTHRRPVGATVAHGRVGCAPAARCPLSASAASRNADTCTVTAPSRLSSTDASQLKVLTGAAHNSRITYICHTSSSETQDCAAAPVALHMRTDEVHRSKPCATPTRHRAQPVLHQRIAVLHSAAYHVPHSPCDLAHHSPPHRRRRTAPGALCCGVSCTTHMCRRQ